MEVRRWFDFDNDSTFRLESMHWNESFQATFLQQALSPTVSLNRDIWKDEENNPFFAAKECVCTWPSYLTLAQGLQTVSSSTVGVRMHLAKYVVYI